MKGNETGRDDTELHGRFAAMRASDRVRTPSFDAVLLRPRAGRIGLAWSAAAVAVATVAVFAVLALRKPAPAPDVAAMPAVMFSVAAEMPSDFLLEPPRDDVRLDAPQLTRAVNDEVPFL